MVGAYFICKGGQKLIKKYYSYSPNAAVFKKVYGDICVTVVLELPSGKKLKKNGRSDAVNVFKEDIYNLLNDSELEKLLNPSRK